MRHGDDGTNARPGWRVWVAIAVGGAVGTGLRLLADLTIAAPWALILVNALGAATLLVLVLAVWPRTPHAPRWLRDGVGTGVLGAFTTLSALSLAFVAPVSVAGAASAGVFAAAVGAGVLGTLLRQGAVLATARVRFPVGVLVVNVLGSLIAGLALGALLRGELDPAAAVVVIAGGCGGLTTFSTVVADTVRAWLAGRPAVALLIAAANLVLGAAAAWVGLHA